VVEEDAIGDQPERVGDGQEAEGRDQHAYSGQDQPAGVRARQAEETQGGGPIGLGPQCG
jgi:hypothetical protein